MSKPGEVYVDLSEEQWATVKAALGGQIADVEAENARLRTDVKEARDFLASALRNVDLARGERDDVMAQTDEALRERDGYKAHMGEAWQEYRRLWLRWFEQRVEYRYAKKREREAEALAELRGEALEARGYHAPGKCWTRRYKVPEGTTCDHCESAIAATPELTTG